MSGAWEESSIQVDAYLDRLLAGRDARPSGLEELPVVDPAVAEAARASQRALVRFHPSFRFEERLVRRLREEALRPAEGTPADVIPLPTTPEADADHGHGLLIGGAIASGVIASSLSLAGAGLLAWRRWRSGRRWERLA